MSNNLKKEIRNKFISSGYDFLSKGIAFLDVWYELDEKANDLTQGRKYPFDQSFDEVLANFHSWISEMQKEIHSLPPTITVKDLKSILESIDEDTQVVVRDEENDGWLNIVEVENPNEESGMFTLTFHTKDNFDTRQF